MTARGTYAAWSEWSSLAAKLARRLTILKEHGRVWSFTCSVGIECGCAVLEAAVIPVSGDALLARWSSFDGKIPAADAEAMRTLADWTDRELKSLMKDSLEAVEDILEKLGEGANENSNNR